MSDNMETPVSTTTYIHAARKGPGLFRVTTQGEGADAEPVLYIDAYPDAGDRVAIVFLSWNQVVELQDLLQDVLKLEPYA